MALVTYEIANAASDEVWKFLTKQSYGNEISILVSRLSKEGESSYLMVGVLNKIIPEIPTYYEHNGHKIHLVQEVTNYISYDMANEASDEVWEFLTTQSYDAEISCLAPYLVEKGKSSYLMVGVIYKIIPEIPTYYEHNGHKIWIKQEVSGRAYAL